MKKSLDISILPEEAQRELLDFYEFLVEKYGKKGKIKKYNWELLKHILPQPIKRFEPIKREDLYGR